MSEQRKQGPEADEPRGLIFRKGLSRDAKVVCIALQWLSRRTGGAWPTREVLAEKLEMSVVMLDRCMRELREQGLVKVKRQGLGRPNLYEVVCPNGTLPESSPVTSQESSPVTTLKRGRKRPDSSPVTTQESSPVTTAKASRTSTSSEAVRTLYEVPPPRRSERRCAPEEEHGKRRSDSVAREAVGNTSTVDQGATALLEMGLTARQAREWAGVFDHMTIKRLCERTRKLARVNPTGFLLRCLKSERMVQSFGRDDESDAARREREMGKRMQRQHVAEREHYARLKAVFGALPQARQEELLARARTQVPVRGAAGEHLVIATAWLLHEEEQG